MQIDSICFGGKNHLMRRSPLKCAYALSAVLLASCSGGGSGGGPPAPGTFVPPVITQSYTFPSGDAVAPMGGIAWDIVGVTTKLSGTGNDPGGNSYDTLEVDVTFAQDVSHALPAPGGILANDGSNLGVRVLIDSDANVTTGFDAPCISNGTFPFEFATNNTQNVPRLADGNLSIFENGVIIYQGAGPIGLAVTGVSGHTISFTYRLIAFGVAKGAAVPRLGVAVAAYKGVNLSTDCAPKDRIEVFTS